uniref:NTF2-related export protein n=1 Tax=Globodera pallida TaxID=36090 RepID=A0A183CQW8_GLOPA
MSSSATKVKLDQEVCADAEKLVRLYTELADMNRPRTVNLYSSEKNAPQLVWNGNLFNGLPEIEAFWRSLPATSHEVTCLDAHRIDPTSDDTSLVVLAMGTVTIGGVSHAYNHSLLLIHEGGTYKIKSDNYRLID